MECHGDRKRRARESSVALHGPEKTTPSTRAGISIHFENNARMIVNVQGDEGFGDQQNNSG